jgi:hypothetical protein
MSDKDPLTQKEKLDAARQSQSTAIGGAVSRTEQRKENPDFAETVRDADVDSAKFNDLEDELGALLSGSHAFGNRDPTYERWAKWVNENRGERLIAERSSGRLCDQSIMQCYREAGKAPQDADARPLESDRKRAFRAAHDAATSYQTLSIETEGLRALTDATTVHKREESSETKSLKERAVGGLD